MRKTIIALSLAVLLSGCALQNKNVDAKAVVYETYYKTVEETTSFVEKSEYYDISTEMISMDDGTFRYYIIIDNPQIAMYDIVALAVEDGISYSANDRMMPSIGIYDSVNSMIPGQVNREAGFVKGLVISGETDQESLAMKMIVEWKDRNREKSYREFVRLQISEQQQEDEETEQVSESEDTEGEEQESDEE